MKNLTKVIVVAIVIAGVSSVASATNIQFQAGFLYKDAAATELLDVGKTAVFVADADGSGWDAYTNGELGDSFAAEGDVVLNAFGINGGMAGDGTHSGDVSWQNDAKGVSQGMEMALLWFDVEYADTLANPGEGTAYGFFRTNQVVAEVGFEVPSNNTSDMMQVFTSSTGAGSIPDSDMAAKYVTVPEPFTMGVLAVGGLAMLRRRRAA
jgi:hypothetical protein